MFTQHRLHLKHNKKSRHIQMPIKLNCMLRSCRRWSRCGFTLIEIMVTLAILSFGILAIYESFFISMDAFGYYANYLDVHWWLNEKIWELEDQLMVTEHLILGSESGAFNTGSKNFTWTTSINPVDESKGVYRIDVSVYWREGKRERFIYRCTYATRQIEKNIHDES
jgi:prepilin-type N-terminal cleavage/methylation domain-containing protein